MCFVLLAVAEFAIKKKKLCSQENVAIWLGLKKPINFLKTVNLAPRLYLVLDDKMSHQHYKSNILLHLLNSLNNLTEMENHRKK
jgi:hypothetical protein